MELKKKVGGKDSGSSKNLFRLKRPVRLSFWRIGPLNLNPAATYSPIRRPYSTIGAEGLNDRVRDGIGCDTSAIATGSSSAVINGRLLRYARIRSLQRNCLNTSALADRRKPR